MLVVCVTLIVLTFFAFEMEFIYTFLIYLLKVKHVYGHTDNQEQYCIEGFYRNETECFYNGFPWTTFPTKFAPVVRLRSMPIHPRKIRPRLLMYNKTSDEWINLNLKKWSSNNQSSIVITHGWAPEKSGKEERLHLLYAKEFYKLLSKNEPDQHLLAIDWKRGASSLNYPECYNNIRVVARYVYKQLSEVDFNFESTHLIGHSLGAHLMGYLAKETIKQTGSKVKRITGLDPAGPGFNFPARWYDEFPNLTDTHLWHTDAHFVDIVHTDAGRFGTGNYGLKTQLGHVDFYPAGGNNQPYCQFSNFYRELKRLQKLEIDDIIRSAAGMQSTCDHRMAKVYLIHSYLHPDLYCACSNKKQTVQCSSINMTQSDDCATMGYYAVAPLEGRHTYQIAANNLPTQMDKLALDGDIVR